VHFARLANTLLKDEERALEPNSMLSPTQWLSSVAVMKRTSLFFRTLCRSAKVIRYAHPASKFSPRISAIPMTRPDWGWGQVPPAMPPVATLLRMRTVDGMDNGIATAPVV